MGASHYLRGDSRNCVARSLPWWESFGLCVADSLTGNHPEDDFTTLETIQRSHSIIGKRIPFELEGETFESERRVGHQYSSMLPLYASPSDPQVSSYFLRMSSLEESIYDASVDGAIDD
ncbi:hypothetical protein Tco_0554326 [Tanacetum coccineum]